MFDQPKYGTVLLLHLQNFLIKFLFQKIISQRWLFHTYFNSVNIMIVRTLTPFMASFCSGPPLKSKKTSALCARSSREGYWWPVHQWRGVSRFERMTPFTNRTLTAFPSQIDWQPMYFSVHPVRVLPLSSIFDKYCVLLRSDWMSSCCFL